MQHACSPKRRTQCDWFACGVEYIQIDNIVQSGSALENIFHNKFNALRAQGSADKNNPKQIEFRQSTQIDKPAYRHT